MRCDEELFELAARAGQHLAATRRRAVTAESCTGGWIAKALTDVPGSSGWFEGGYVTYSNAAKMRDLDVQSETLAVHGAVSEATVREMALGALRASGADIAVAVTGVAGPTGGSEAKSVGTVWFALARLAAEAAVRARRMQFAGDREAIRREAVAFALGLLL
ncbi:MAG: nicotinamide-nucleotide amidohydrolase family protein, partial [Steroidobacteraceae bacterium]